MMQTALLSIMFVGCQVEQNAEEEVQQYMNNEGIMVGGLTVFGNHALILVL